MTLPARLAAEVGHALGARIAQAYPVGGGCIHRGTRVETDGGATYFLKWNDAAPAGMFAAEWDGLQAIRAAQSLRVPEAVARGNDWILLEYVTPGRPTADTHPQLGRGLAALHASTTALAFGWHRDNWIGSLPQANTPTADWAEFWRDRRIGPQLERAGALGRLGPRKDRSTFERVVALTPTALAGVTRPELVHGDLWSGNWLVDPTGAPTLIDPAVYLGDGEVDLAMSELFGGFERSFYTAYEEARGTSPEYRAYRRDLYQLYYLLVHVNLFGSAYEAGSLRAAQRVVAALI